MDRARMLQSTDVTHGARPRGDKKAVASRLAPGSRYQVAGHACPSSDFPAGPDEPHGHQHAD